jgi:hypothetical protein
MLGEVPASFISTAELEMQTAPAVAAATGDTGLPAIKTDLAAIKPPYHHVTTKSGLW